VPGPRHRGRSAPVALVLAAAVTLSGCVADRADDTGGGPIPQQFDGEIYPGPAREVSGEVRIADNGCVLLVEGARRRLLVFPAGASWDGTGVVLPDATKVVDGDVVSGPGRYTPVDALPGGDAGYWGSQVLFCTPDAPDVAVMDGIRTP